MENPDEKCKRDYCIHPKRDHAYGELAGACSSPGCWCPSYIDWLPESTGEIAQLLEKNAPKPVKPDMVNHPPHYGSHPSGVECIQITEHMNFCLGNAVKYIWRADLKNGLEDLEKAVWYINREIERRKATESD